MPTSRVMTPAGFAHHASRGAWVCPPHLALLNRELVDLATRRTEGLVVEMPPRHGKSEMASKYFPAWYLGMHPRHRVVMVSYEERFATTWGRKVQDILAEHGKATFGVEVSRAVSAAGDWELEKSGGGMYCCGIGGAITGRGADLLIIDDPVKNAEEALSESSRRAKADWLVSTGLSRLEPGGVVLLIQTRWHEQDVAGMVLAGEVGSDLAWKELRLPALAEEDDPLGRRPGEALWPQRYSREKLEAIRAAGEKNAGSSAFWFEALYQQRPVPKSGGMFHEDWFGPDRLVHSLPSGGEFCRYWDRAGTEGGGCFTVGVLMHAASPEGPFTVCHVARFQHADERRDALIREHCVADNARLGPMLTRGEQEPGSSGKDAASAIVRKLAGYDAEWSTVSGDKETRARPLAAQMAARNVFFLADGTWDFPAFAAEFLRFPRGKYKDQVDACSGSFNCLCDGGEVFASSVAGPRRGYV